MTPAAGLIAALVCMLVVPAVIGTPFVASGPTRWCIGAVVLAWTVAALHAAGAPQSLAIGGPLVTLMLLGLRARLVARRTGANGVRIRLPTLLLLVALGVPLALATLGTPVDAWDAVAIWYAKTRGLFAWQPVTALSVANYPNLGPTAWMLVLHITGPEAEPVARLVFPAIYLAWIGGLCASVSRSHAWFAAIVVGVGALQFLDVGAITSGYQDVVVTAVAGTAALFFLQDLEKTSAEVESRPELIGAALAGSLGMIKAEGAVLGTILLLAWAAARWRQPTPFEKGSTLRAACLFVPLVAAWPVLSFVNGIDPASVHMGLRPASLLAVPSRFDRWSPILIAMLRQAPPRFFGMLAAMVVSMATGWLIPAARRTIGFLWGVLLLQYLFVVLVLFSVDHAFDWYVATACGRLVSLADFVPLTLLAVCAMRIAGAAQKRFE